MGGSRDHDFQFATKRCTVLTKQPPDLNQTRTINRVPRFLRRDQLTGFVQVCGGFN